MFNFSRIFEILKTFQILNNYLNHLNRLETVSLGILEYFLIQDGKNRIVKILKII